MAQERRKDKTRVVLKTGEGQRNNGTYYYRWQDKKGKRHYLYARSLKELREKEKEIEKDLFDGIKIEARYMTVPLFTIITGTEIIRRGITSASIHPKQKQESVWCRCWTL